MNEIQKQYGPFAHATTFGGATHCLTCDVVSRIAMVRQSIDAEWLAAVIKHRGTQKTVRLAAERRLRAVNRQSSGTAADGNA